MPELRRAYLGWPWPHLYEHPSNIASVAVARDYWGEPAVLFAHFRSPERQTLADLEARLVPLRLVAAIATSRGVLGEGPFAAAADRQVPAAEVVDVVDAHRQDVVACIARPRRRDVGAVGEAAAGPPAVFSIASSGDLNGSRPGRINVPTVYSLCQRIRPAPAS